MSQSKPKPILKRISCQDSNCGKRVSPFEANWEVRGCNTCGGYGYLFEQFKLECCGRSTWLRPDPITVYHGKKFQTLDGIMLIFRDDGHVVCDDCYMVVPHLKRKDDISVVERPVLEVTEVDKVKRSVTMRLKRSKRVKKKF